MSKGALWYFKTPSHLNEHHFMTPHYCLRPSKARLSLQKSLASLSSRQTTQECSSLHLSMPHLSSSWKLRLSGHWFQCPGNRILSNLEASERELRSLSWSKRQCQFSFTFYYISGKSIFHKKETVFILSKKLFDFYRKLHFVLYYGNTKRLCFR